MELFMPTNIHTFLIVCICIFVIGPTVYKIYQKIPACINIIKYILPPLLSHTPPSKMSD